MLLVRTLYKNKEISLVMQNAETIRLTSLSGKPISVTKLKKDDKILAYLQEAGRHFGVKVKESIKEK
ncbi:MAG: 3-dehydroquinate synthase II, partial [Candidatus Moranbacteria bacterium CG23_combo_of_CG06-09_8_20_14_all_39_10]